MAGSGNIYLRRGEGASIKLQFQALQGNKLQAADLADAPLVVELLEMPARASVLRIWPGYSQDECALTVDADDTSIARLELSDSFLSRLSFGEYAVRSTVGTEQHVSVLGEDIIELVG